MATQITTKSDFQKKIVNGSSPRLIIFFDKNSDKKRVKRYEEIAQEAFPEIKAFKLDLDDNLLDEQEEEKYVECKLICCTGICNETIFCESSPDKKTFQSLMQKLADCD